MSWLIWIFGAVACFYVVGKLTSKSDKPLVSVENGVVTYKTERDKYLPWTEQPYHHIHHFKLFGTDAALSWNDGDGDVDVWCISRFSKGEPQTSVHTRYNYSIADRVWNEAPKGAARECLAEIRKVLKLS